MIAQGLHCCEIGRCYTTGYITSDKRKMKPPDLPSFTTVTLSELRRLWTVYPDPDVRRLMLEVERSRRVLREINELYVTIHQSWRENVGGNLVALHLLQKLLWEETTRLE